MFTAVIDELAASSKDNLVTTFYSDKCGGQG
jgi:hypothetical protein